MYTNVKYVLHHSLNVTFFNTLYGKVKYNWTVLKGEVKSKMVLTIICSLQPHYLKHNILINILFAKYEITRKIHLFWSISRGGHFATCRWLTMTLIKYVINGAPEQCLITGFHLTDQWTILFTIKKIKKILYSERIGEFANSQIFGGVIYPLLFAEKLTWLLFIFSCTWENNNLM